MDPTKVSFKAGEVVQDWVKPFIKVLLREEKERRCANCFKRPEVGSELKRCAACKINHYCSTTCQKEDWDFAHRAECKLPLFRRPLAIFGEIFGVDSYWNAVVARVLAHFKLHPDQEIKEVAMYDGTLRSFSSLVAHVDSGEVHLDHMAQKMSTSLTHKDSKWRPEYIRKIVGIWKTNAFELLNGGKKKIGAALVMEVSVFDHSCRPTALANVDSGEGWRAQVRAIVDIPSGDQPLISYLPGAGVMTRAERQLRLNLVFNFSCECDLCEREKAGQPATDYEQVKDFEENYEAILCRVLAVRKGSTLEAIVNLRDKIIGLYGPLCHTYDQRITSVAARVLIFMFDNYSSLKKVGGSVGLVSKVANDTLKRLKMTYGAEHMEYQLCKACLIDFGIDSLTE